MVKHSRYYKAMTKNAQPFLVALFLSLGWSAYAQSDINVTYNGNPINLDDGIDLSKVTYPLVRLELNANEEIRGHYTHMEWTIVRGGRAVYSMRVNPAGESGKMSLKNLLDHARPGDNISIQLGKTSGLKERKIISFPVS